ncbi:MAG: hydrogenase maturation nickel metallochaperone HypA [Desulfovibrio sp.]|nr:hydrogenase maturation nickel metallochaperone HypA [Desulfovibrio sp.]
MHEASLVQGLLDLVLQTVAEQNLHVDCPILHIEEIVCELGIFSCVEPRTLASCFELFAEGTIAEGCKLTLNVAPLQCQCMDCGEKFTVTKRVFHCPVCESENIHFDGGHGLMLISLRVETEEKDNARTCSG